MTISNLYIKCLKSEKIESGARYGQFLINSLRPGQGITVGNLLRRVLLSDLGGTTITAVRIAGVRDEFSIIPGVREDVLEILLNLKGIVFQTKSTDVQFGRLKIKGPAVITADAIQGPSDLKIVNPNHYIATISTPSVLEIEFKFEYGTGYKLAGQTFCDKSEDFLQIDAIFMPIQKVDFKIENVYDNSNYITERLFLDIWTNGSISPDEAVFSASKFIIDFFNIFTNLPHIPKVAIENPIGIMSNLWRKPDQIIQPYMFGDEFSKSTCLWLKGLPLLTPTKMVGKGEFKEWIDKKTGKKKRQALWFYEAFANSKSSAERSTIRSKTFQGIADAMGQQWA